MSTVQVLKKKQLTFEEICPQWNEVISRNGTIPLVYLGPKGSELCLTNYKCCIVGEAHGFSLDYNIVGSGCERCVKFANSFIDYGHANAGFNSLKDDFVEHWNAKHVAY
jgi:hypothetical protein